MHGRKGTLLFGISTLIIAGMSLTGCDYWPPALQAQIEQLQQEAQVAAAERTKMVAQLNESNTAKQELQARVDDLTRVNRELTGKISGLEQSLTAEREKASRLAKATSRPAAAKAATKPAAKSIAKKKPAPKKRAA